MSNLTVTTPGDREILITRVFRAPRNLVFECLTTPALLERWMLGPPGWSLDVPEFDLKVGGRFRYMWRKEGGKEMGMSGEFREITPFDRLVHTELFDEDWTAGETLVTYRLTEEGGRTTLAMTILYSSREARDMVLQSPMDSGVVASYERLDDLLASLAVR